jgi:RimJ/RimL family protein N-acetyltransferase
VASKDDKLITTPLLVGKKVYLRPGTADDAANWQYWLLQSEPETVSCRPVALVSPAEASQQFQKKEKTAWEQRLAVVRKEDQMLVGEAAFFNHNAVNRSAEVWLLIDPDERKKGYGKEALRLLCRYLLHHRGLNKVYVQVSEFNEAAVRLLESLRFRREAVLRDHYFYQGEFHNGFIYSLLLYELAW